MIDSIADIPHFLPLCPPPVFNIESCRIFYGLAWPRGGKHLLYPIAKAQSHISM